MTARKPATIGLFGFGCVGYGLHEVLEKTPGLKAVIKTICVKDPAKSRPLPMDRFTFEERDILDDPDINVVVELIDDADAAFRIVAEAMRGGKSVVTANKRMVAGHFRELLALQEQHGVSLLYEAACCASIPIIRNLEEYYDNDLLESVEGIVNGATNYILTRTSVEGMPYADALREAQRLGYAESDPTLDTRGFDAKFKLVIILAHAFGVVAGPDEIFTAGIEQIGELETRYAREKGFKIKLVAHAYKTQEGRVQCYVLPKFVDASDKLFVVDDVYNGVKTKTAFSDVQFFVGKGAGSHPTASAVLSDLSALTFDYHYEYKKLHQEPKLTLDNDVLLPIMLRHPPELQGHFSTFFDCIRETYQNREAGYIMGDMHLAELRKVAEHERVSVVLSEQQRE